MLGIKGYKEYSSTYEDSTRRVLTAIVEYDTNGNMIRNFRHDLKGGWVNQTTWKYDEHNRLIEETSFAPDSLTILQRFYHCYDERGNKIEYIAENYSQGTFSAASRTVNGYDSLGHLLSIKVYTSNGLFTHYEYRYSPQGFRTEELVYSPEGKLLWKRPYSDYYEEREPYGFPSERDPELEELLRVTKTYDPKTGNITYADGYGRRIFNTAGLLIYWYEGYFKHHWFEYRFF